MFASGLASKRPAAIDLGVGKSSAGPVEFTVENFEKHYHPGLFGFGGRAHWLRKTPNLPQRKHCVRWVLSSGKRYQLAFLVILRQAF